VINLFQNTLQELGARWTETPLDSWQNLAWLLRSHMTSSKFLDCPETKMGILWRAVALFVYNCPQKYSNSDSYFYCYYQIMSKSS
jgi:hypothetical protein